MKQILRNYGKFILPGITALLALLLVLSYLFPNRVLDTYVMNISGEENEESEITLPEGSVISYTMNTGKRPMRGIQPCIGIQGGMFENGVIRYRVYKGDSDTLLSDNEYRLQELSRAVLESLEALPEGADAAEIQAASAARYIYLPFEDYETCKGEIRLEFTYQGNGDEPARMTWQEGPVPVPVLIVNDVHRDGTATEKDGVEIAGSLVGYTVYTHNTYPLVYDLRILVFLFLAATAAAPLYGRKKKAAVETQEPVDKERSGNPVRKTWLLCAAVTVFAVLTALAGEFLFYTAGHNRRNEGVIELTGHPGIRSEYRIRSGRIRLSEQEEKGILLERENGRILAELNGTEYVPEENKDLEETEEGMFWKVKRTVFTVTPKELLFIRNLVIECPPTQEGTEILVEIERDGVWEEYESFYVDERIQTGSCRLNQDVSSLRVTLSNVDEIDGSRVRLSVQNDRPLNPVRFYFVFVLTLLAGFYILNKQWFAQHPERVFALTSLLLGSALIYAIGTNQVGYDEHIHFTTAYNRSFLTMVQTTESAMQMEAGTFPAFSNAPERKLVEEYAQANHDYSWANLTWQSRFPSYEVRSYLPLSAGLLIGRLLSLPFHWCIMLAKFCNLLCYTALGYLAVRTAKQGKVLAAALGLMPNCLFAACVFSYDSVVNGFLLLAMVMTTNLFLERHAKITWLQTLLILGAFIAGSTAKLIYILMALLLVFPGKDRFGSRLRELLFKASVIAVCGFMVYTIFFPPVSASSNYELIGNLNYAADARAQGSNVLGQISYMLDNPLAYARLLLGSMGGELVQYVSGRKIFLNYGYLGDLDVNWMRIGLAAIVAAVSLIPRGETRRTLSGRVKTLYLVMVLGVSAVIWTSMYISFTAVGSTVIEGVQGRYFIPLLLPFFFCLMGKDRPELHVKLGQGMFAKLVLGVFAAMNLYAAAALAVVQCL